MNKKIENNSDQNLKSKKSSEQITREKAKKRLKEIAKTATVEDVTSPIEDEWEVF